MRVKLFAWCLAMSSFSPLKLLSRKQEGNATILGFSSTGKKGCGRVRSTQSLSTRVSALRREGRGGEAGGVDPFARGLGARGVCRVIGELGPWAQR